MLTDGIGSHISISNDGAVIVFARDSGLWAINRDGSQERLLVSEADFAAIPPVDPGVRLGQIYWIPCTHQLLFDTRPLYESGIYYNDDLYLVDTDALLLKNLFPAEKGGHVYFSPNGQQMALVTTHSITLANYDGSSPQVVLTYPQISTNGPTYLYPRPMWSLDSQSLYVAIPPSDPMQDNPSPTALWSLPVYGAEAVKLIEFGAAWNNYSVAPDFSLIVYPTIIREGENASQIVHIIQLDGTEITSFPARGYYGLFSWSPDVTHYIFPSDGEFYVGDLAGQIVQIVDIDSNVQGISWIDNNRFLVYHSEEAGQEKLSLGTISGELFLIAQGNLGAYAIVK